MTALILYRIDPGKRMRRFYRLDVQPNLFGQWCLIREWGRIGRSGQRRSRPFHTVEAAQTALHRQRVLKERRGYQA
jgi:predicted DNA-binding WGR domain protein